MNRIKELLKKYPRKSLAIGIVLLLLVCAVISSLTYFLLLNNRSQKSTNNQESTSTPTPSPTKDATPVPTNIIREKKIIYTTTTATEKRDFWTINLDGSKNIKLSKSEIRAVSNFPVTDYYTYSLQGDYSSIYIANYNTDEEYKVSLPNKSGLFVNLTGEAFSADGKYFLYKAYITEDCKSEGGCEEKDVAPDYLNGLYSYNLVTKQTNFIGKYFLFNNWSKDYKIAYFSDFDKGIYEYNFETNQLKLIDAKDSFAFNAVTLDNGIKFNFKGSTTTENVLTITQNGVQKYKESSVFADLQPFFNTSPDHKFGIFERTKTRINSYTYSEFVLVDLTTFKTKILFTSKVGSVGQQGYWLDNENYVFTVSTSTDGSYRNKNINVYNVVTGKTAILVNTQNVDTVLDY